MMKEPKAFRRNWPKLSTIKFTPFLCRTLLEEFRATLKMHLIYTMTTTMNFALLETRLEEVNRVDSEILSGDFESELVYDINFSNI